MAERVWSEKNLVRRANRRLTGQTPYERLLQKTQPSSQGVDDQKQHS